MRKYWIVWVALAVAWTAWAQLPPSEGGSGKELPEYRFELPDSLAHLTPWQPAFDDPTSRVLPNPPVSMTSVIVLPRENLPKRFDFPENKVYRTPRVWISNGQAWNWGPYPDSYLDARTLSFPMPR